MFVTFYETFVHCCIDCLQNVTNRDELPVGLKFYEFSFLRRVDEGKFSGGLMIRRVARGKEKEKVVNKRAMVASVWCGVLWLWWAYKYSVWLHVCMSADLISCAPPARNLPSGKSKQTAVKLSASGHNLERPKAANCAAGRFTTLDL